MTDPLRRHGLSSSRQMKRSRLLLGCGSAAMALALVLSPQRAHAQGIQAGADVVFGSAEVSNINATTTQVDIFAPTVVINWTPDIDNSGNARDFLRTGATAIFSSDQLTNFAVLNRILPTQNNNVAVINGTVLGQISDGAGGLTTGGFIAFYSPTGILVGPNATFDVGSLLLTTLDSSPASFENFSQGGFLTLQGQQGTTAGIDIRQGAQIRALRENSFFAAVGAEVEMRGTSRVNGSQAYVAGELVNLRFSNGLFDIFVPVGTSADGEVLRLDGNIGGPASTGAGDNHIIYGVMTAARDPISMLLRGNVGFDPAQSAGIINGEIILSANYNVFGRNVAGGTISDGIGARFRQIDGQSDLQANIGITDFSATSSLLAIGTHSVVAEAGDAASSVAGNLLLVGRQSASLNALAGRSFTVSGDVLVDASDYGSVSSSLQSLDQINAQGGNAIINAFAGANVTIGGSAFVSADAFAGAEDLGRIAGSARGGSAQIRGLGGRVAIGGDATVTARGVGTTLSGMRTGAESRGGLAQILASQGGAASVGQNLFVQAGAIGARGDTFSPSTVSNVFGGQAFVSIFEGGGTLTVGGSASVDATARSGSSNTAGAGSLANGGQAEAFINGAGQMTITGELLLDAGAVAGDNRGGTGGQATGGVARALTTNGNGVMNVAGRFVADASASGGRGATGGNAFGGVAGAVALTGSITLQSDADAFAFATGGGVASGLFGGNGGTGRGGSAAFRAIGLSNLRASLTIGGNVVADATGLGGDGGDGDGQAIAGGNGGDGRGGDLGTLLQADPFGTAGAYLVASGDFGTLRVDGTATIVSQGFGGRGGAAIGQSPAGTGGSGVGGTAQAGLNVFGSPAFIRQGSARFGGDVVLDASGQGGSGGLDNGDIPLGEGGAGAGGTAEILAFAGQITALGNIQILASGRGGDNVSALGGAVGRGGQAGVRGDQGGRFNGTTLDISADGSGGGIADEGIGGSVFVQANGLFMALTGNLLMRALGTGGSSGSAAGVGGNGTGGNAFVGMADPFNAGTISVAGHTQLRVEGIGAGSIGAFAAGNGVGGQAVIQSQGGSVITLNSAQVIANGVGGQAASHQGGSGTGGFIDLRSSGLFAQLNIDNNVPAQFTTGPGGGAMLSADGIGRDANGGNGVGGAGVGGTISINATDRGRLNLPFGSTQPVAIFARGFGGNSSVAGGVGGTARGGLATIVADGLDTSISIGRSQFDVSAQGGSSSDSTANITGGFAVGGARLIRVTSEAEMLLEQVDGETGARGGDGSGTGRGGNVLTGSNVIQLDGGRINVTDTLGLRDNSRGGNGRIGGNVALGDGEGGNPLGQSSFTAVNSFVNVSSFGQNADGIIFESLATGGTGVEEGGTAQSNPVTFTLQDSRYNSGSLRMRSVATGGNATGSAGIGGIARSGNIVVSANASSMDLSGGNLFETAAFGGNGAFGGDGLAGNITAEFNVFSSFIGDELRFVSQAGAGQGLNVNGESGVGNAVAGNVSLRLVDTELFGGTLELRADATAESLNPEVAGGSATAGLTELAVAGDSPIDIFGLRFVANALTSFGQREEVIGIDINGNPIIGTIFDFSGEAFGGRNRLVIEDDTVGGITTRFLSMDAGGTGGGREVGGQFSIEVLGGQLNADFLDARVFGFEPGLNTVSQVIVSDAALLSQNINLATIGDLDLVTIDGGIIGSNGAAGTTNAVFARAEGTLSIRNVLSTGPGVTNVSNGTNLQPFSPVTTSGGIGGVDINLFAGGSLLLDGRVISSDGTISLVANDFGGFFSPQPNVLTMSALSRIDAGTGNVLIRMTGTGSTTGDIMLGTIRAGQIAVANDSNSDIRLRAGSTLTASGSERAIDLAAFGGEVIDENTLATNPTSGLVLTGGGHFGIYAATPEGSSVFGVEPRNRRYNVNPANYREIFIDPGLNFAAYRIRPVLTISAADFVRLYGDPNPNFSAIISGFLTGDDASSLTGTPIFTTSAGQFSNVGNYAIDLALGSLFSVQGYQIVLDPTTGGRGTLTVNPRPITITADSFSRIYGNANPNLTFTVGGLGLVNGDQLTGALATAANLTTGVGNIAITQGTLAASPNYAVTFVNGTLTITPRPLTITADSFSRVYGNANPALTFTVGGLGLVNGDQLTGALATAANLTTGVGNIAITQGTLAASSNYAVTFVNGTLTITPRPLTITADSFSRVYGNANPNLTFTVGGAGLVNGDQLTGTLATAANLTTGVGSIAITQGSLTAGPNYAISFVGGLLTITPRPITVIADNLSKILGQPDPILTFRVSGDGLVNGDQFTGALAREIGEAVGTFAIRQGTLTAGANYVIQFTNGQFTIDPPPAPESINNPTVFERPVAPIKPRISAESEDEERYGVDFPEQPEAPLITEDPLLDDPVASGGDASVYGGTATPAPGGK